MIFLGECNRMDTKYFIHGYLMEKEALANRISMPIKPMNKKVVGLNTPIDKLGIKQNTESEGPAVPTNRDYQATLSNKA